MELKALLIGSIGVLVESSDIQRRAYNRALEEAGVDWHWDPDRYRELLRQPGGRSRLSRLAAETGRLLSETEIDSIHARKTEISCEEIVSAGLPLRPGVAATIASAIERGLAVALVTTTYRANIDAIAEAVGDALPLERFDAVLTVSDCTHPKPAPDIYREALTRLGLLAAEAIAVEDSAASVRAAKGAGIYTVATPGLFTQDQDFSEADDVLESLDGFDLPP